MSQPSEILIGDVCEKLRELPEASVHCVVTSPPYWGLRDYGAPGQIGLEPTMAEFVDKMVAVFREVKRVLRDDGTCWVNLGDSYNAYNGGAGPGSTLSKTQTEARPWLESGDGLRSKGLKPKDLCGIPWRVAFALQADGWYLRSDIIWHKPNPMPESVTDRPTKAHEYLFLLTKSARYYYDAEAIREEHTQAHSWGNERRHLIGEDRLGAPTLQTSMRLGNHPAGRNKRTVWTIATQPYPEAHFATYPEALVKPCILAGCPHKVCAVCGAPWVREVEATAYTPDVVPVGVRNVDESRQDKTRKLSGAEYNKQVKRKTTGWLPTCTHNADTTGGTVLDPFLGSGTTAVVAAKEGRRWIGIELNPEYAALAEKRIPARQEMLL